MHSFAPLCYLKIFCKIQRDFWQHFDKKNEIAELCKGVHCVDLGESFQKHIYSQILASIQPRTSPLKFARSPPLGLARNRRGLPPHAPAPTHPHTYTCHRLTLLHPVRYLVVGETVVTRKRRNNNGKKLTPVLAVCGCHTRELVPLSLIHAKRTRENISIWTLVGEKKGFTLPKQKSVHYLDRWRPLRIDSMISILRLVLRKGVDSGRK